MTTFEGAAFKPVGGGELPLERLPLASAHRYRSNSSSGHMIHRSGDSTCADHALVDGRPIGAVRLRECPVCGLLQHLPRQVARTIPRSSRGRAMTMKGSPGGMILGSIIACMTQWRSWIASGFSLIACCAGYNLRPGWEAK
jgi:hypothetical protein